MDKILATTEESETDLPRLFRHIEVAEHNNTSAKGLSLYYRYFVKTTGFYGDKSLRFVGLGMQRSHRGHEAHETGV